MDSRQVLELGVAFFGQANAYLSPIVHTPANSLDQLALLQPVEQTHGAVMADQQVSCQTTNRWAVAASQGFDGQQHLVLVGLQSLGAGGVFAEVEESPNLEAEIAEGSIITGR